MPRKRSTVRAAVGSPLVIRLVAPPNRRCGFVLSLGIELAQSAIPGRTTATADVLCNTLGAAAGWLVAARLSP